MPVSKPDLVADATVVSVPGKAQPYYLLFQDERTGPLEKRISVANGPSLEGPWQDTGSPVSDTGSEGSAVIKVAGGYLAYYDHSANPQHYAAAFTPDMQNWSDATSKIAFPAGLHHGSILHLETSEYNLLRFYHGTTDSAMSK